MVQKSSVKKNKTKNRFAAMESEWHDNVRVFTPSHLIPPLLLQLPAGIKHGKTSIKDTGFESMLGLFFGLFVSK